MACNREDGVVRPLFTSTIAAMRLAIVALLLATPAAADSNVPVNSEWAGTYTCAQGITNVRLTIETRTGGGAATGHFEFGPNDANKSVPRGDYWLKGAMHADADGKLEVKLRPDRWGTRPSGYVMVGLTARSGRDQHSLVGTIDYETCTTISLERVHAEAE
jgi:hypothetical protein